MLHDCSTAALMLLCPCLLHMFVHPIHTRITNGKACVTAQMLTSPELLRAISWFPQCTKQCAQVMRHDVTLAIGKSGPNVDVMCTDKELGGRFMPFSKVSPGPLHVPCSPY